VVNGNVVGKIIPSRGIRQGDPISLYLFIICAEAFSSLLQNAQLKGFIPGVPTSKKCSKITHLFFADDSLVFCKANHAEWRRLLNILDVYERGSGQKINLNKTVVFFSLNISRRQEILSLSGLSEANRFKQNALFIWKSFMAAKELLSHGIIWRVGDGKSIKIWGDKWLPNIGSMSFSPVSSLHCDVKVSDLLMFLFKSGIVLLSIAHFLPMRQR
jgi:hypothetical protein